MIHLTLNEENLPQGIFKLLHLKLFFFCLVPGNIVMLLSSTLFMFFTDLLLCPFNYEAAQKLPARSP